jgi:hypothetical protein
LLLRRRGHRPRVSDEREQGAPEPRESDETLREAQTGKGYGEDEGEREAAVEDTGEGPRPANPERH